MYPEPFLDENHGTLLSIESIVVAYYREHPNLSDSNVEKVYNSLQRVFDKEVQGKNPPKLRFNDLEQDLFDRIEAICRILVGDDDAEPLSEDEQETVETDSEEIEALEIDPVPKDVMVKCMKRLRSSIKTWTGRNAYGRQGYLNYVSSFIG